MAERNPHAGRAEFGDEMRGNFLGRQRHNDDAFARRAQESKIFRRGPAQRAGIVHAGLFWRQERAFKMNPEHAGLYSNKRFHGGKPGAHFFSGVADQRRQK